MGAFECSTVRGFEGSGEGTKSVRQFDGSAVREFTERPAGSGRRAAGSEQGERPAGRWQLAEGRGE
jgi:hypothetical protein